MLINGGFKNKNKEELPVFLFLLKCSELIKNPKKRRSMKVVDHVQAVISLIVITMGLYIFLLGLYGLSVRKKKNETKKRLLEEEDEDEEVQEVETGKQHAVNLTSFISRTHC